MRDKRQNNLKAFVGLHHYPQKRKYTGEPYMVHLVAVAEMAEANGLDFGYEIGLCHDLLEDTACDEFELDLALQRFGYTDKESFFIVTSVQDLTDVYTKESYPELNRFNRKLRENKRLSLIPENTQSIKYCDLIDNTKSIVEHDPAFAKVYLAEKLALLKLMDKGDHSLYKEAFRYVLW